MQVFVVIREATRSTRGAPNAYRVGLLVYNLGMKYVFRLALVGTFGVLVPSLAAQQPAASTQNRQSTHASDPLPRSDSDQSTEAPPLSPNESSSKQTQIDLSPPANDAATHPNSEIPDVTEMHAWNPHKAQKDIEVGEFYLKRKNYRAAEDRFREALEYKPGDAIATYRLAEALDGLGQYPEAIKNYQEYLKIPSNDKFGSEAKKALARLEKKESAEKR
ncbi:MAG TPA: tetratricopeptide repeat protein [Terriglobales bacterium]|nr:tetratricopeptide repeat protein [Terriglobales bacterium]